MNKEKPPQNNIKLGHRALKAIENENQQEYVIKTSLKSIFQDQINDNEIEIIKETLKQRMIEMSKGYQRLSFAVNLFYLDHLEQNKEIPKVIDTTVC